MASPGTSALRGVRVAMVSDALDQLGIRNQALDPSIAPLRPGMTLTGRAVPIVVEATDELPDEPYAQELRAVESLQPGDVPVYATDSSVKAALWGEIFSYAARARGAVGAVVDGFVRDSQQVGHLQYPVFCRGSSPLDTRGRAEVREFGVRAACGGVHVSPGDHIVGDDDGVIVIPAEALSSVLDLVGQRNLEERGALADLLSGTSIGDVWKKWRVL